MKRAAEAHEGTIGKAGNMIKGLNRRVDGTCLGMT